jgi:hypothetical protein
MHHEGNLPLDRVVGIVCETNAVSVRVGKQITGEVADVREVYMKALKELLNLRMPPVNSMVGDLGEVMCPRINTNACATGRLCAPGISRAASVLEDLFSGSSNESLLTFAGRHTHFSFYEMTFE